MKIKIYLVTSIFLIILTAKLSYSNNSDLTPGELIIYNRSSSTLKVAVYPIGAIFSSPLLVFLSEAKVTNKEGLKYL